MAVKNVSQYEYVAHSFMQGNGQGSTGERYESERGIVPGMSPKEQ